MKASLVEMVINFEQYWSNFFSVKIFYETNQIGQLPDINVKAADGTLKRPIRYPSVSGWTLLKDTDCMGSDLPEMTPAADIHACIEQC